MATTTSTRDSGLLDYLLPIFKNDSGIEVKVVAVGTGQAIAIGRNGDADILFVHDTPSENKVVSDGVSKRRDDVMYNDFILIGPKDDPHKIGERFNGDILGAFNYIKENNITYISRGDDSGTHKRELRLLNAAGINDLNSSWYLSVGNGMGYTIIVADEKESYALSDRGTYLKMKNNIDLDIIVEGDQMLFNQYGILVIDTSVSDEIRKKDAEMFREWILSDKIQSLIGNFGIEEYGQPLFIPNAK